MAVVSRFNDDWTVDVVGKMHKYRITSNMLAEECNYRPEYVSTVLNTRKEFMTEKGKEKTKDVIYAGLERLIQRIDDEYMSGDDYDGEF